MAARCPMSPARGATGFALLVALLWACGGEPPSRPEQRHESLEAFAASRAARPDRRVVMIGIDGASWDYLRPHLEAGELPGLARLVREGATATLRSIECHFTPPAWTTMLTGQLPPKTGIYSFGSWDAEAGDFRKVRSDALRVPPVWDLAGRAGLRVEVIGVPATWPPHPVNGVMVTGLMTPKTRLPPLDLAPAPERRRPPDPSVRSFAPVLAGALEDEHNVLLTTFADAVDDGEARYDTVRLRVAHKGLGPLERRLLGEYSFPVGAFSPWVRTRLGKGPAAPEGFLKLRFEDPGPGGLRFLLTPTFLRARHPFTYPASLADDLYARFGYYLPHEFLSIGVLESITREAASHARHFFSQPDWDLMLYVFGQSDNAHHLIGFGEEALPVYRQIDAFVGEVLDASGPETAVVVTSDHGFGAFDYAVDLNQFLAQEGLLAWESHGVIDHASTLVFHNMWYLYFNRALLSEGTLRERGIEVEPGQSPEEALTAHLVRRARELRAPDGTPFPVELARLPEGAVGDAPDLAVRALDDVWIEFWNVDRPSPQVVRRLTGDERWKHARDGVLAVRGGGVAAGRDLGVVDIQDVAPLLLDLLGLPLADDLDGAPIAGLFEGEAARRTLHRVASYGPLERDPVAAPDDDPATFEETLRALGYVRD